MCTSIQQDGQSKFYTKISNFISFQIAVAEFSYSKSLEGKKLLDEEAGSGYISRMHRNSFMHPKYIHYCTN